MQHSILFVVQYMFGILSKGMLLTFCMRCFIFFRLPFFFSESNGLTTVCLAVMFVPYRIFVSRTIYLLIYQSGRKKNLLHLFGVCFD